MNLLDMESEKFKNVKVRGYNFKIRFMTPMDRVQVAQRRMLLQNGNPVEAMTESDFLFFENIAINDICIEESPKDFNEHESCINWGDIEIINSVAHEIRKHTNELESKLKKNKPIDGGEPA